MEEKKLLNSLVTAMGELKNPPKNGFNPHFKNKYATLDIVCDEIREKFAKNKISILQIPIEKEGKIVLQTKIIGYGETMDFGDYPINSEKNSPQSIGSALTYARRYVLCSICGIAAEEDDDANSAENNKEKEQKKENFIAVSTINPKVKAETMKKLNEYIKKRDKLEKLSAEEMKKWFLENIKSDLTKCDESYVLEIIAL